MTSNEPVFRYTAPDGREWRSDWHVVNLVVPELKKLSETVNGDVFFLRADPATIYERYDNPKWKDSSFLMLGDEVYRPMEHVGTGMSDQEVIVVHNTNHTVGIAE